METAIKWHGGKAYLADWIIGHFPPHTHYVEPFFGGGSVLFAKPPEWVDGHSEVVGDLNGELTNFWDVLRDDRLFARFQRAVRATPCSEGEFRLAKFTLESRSLMDPVDRAVAFFVVNRQSRQGLGKDFATLAKTRTRRGMNELPSAWLSAIEGLPAFHARLQRVVILDRPALKVIETQDGPDTLFYLDPPYLHSTRSTVGEYRDCEMSTEQHRALLETLGSIVGRFILSGYPSALYDGIAEHCGWRRVSREIDNKASGSKVKEKKVECLWMNF